MTSKLQPELIQRLEKLAERRQCTLNELLSDVADDLEQVQFPGNPYTLLDQSPALITVCDWDGNYLYVNNAFCEALGYDRETLLTGQFPAFLHPDDLDHMISVAQRLTDGKKLAHMENRYLHKDGSYRWFSWTAMPDGDYVYAIALDVTEQKRIKADLQQSLAHNRRVLQNTSDGFMIGDRDGHIVKVNQRFCEMLGYSETELLQMQVYDLDVALSHQQMDTNAEQVVDEYQPLLLETQHRHKDGHLLHVEISSIPIENDLIACFIRDITARKALEQKLRQSEQYHRGLIESQTDFVCRYTPDTILTYVNDAYCRHFGKSREELIGKSFLTLASDVDESAIFARIDELREDPSPDVRRFHTYDATGEKRWIEWTDFGIQDATGKLVEIQAVGHDITHVLETKERLQEREEMLSTIFKNIPVMLAQFDEAGDFEYVNKHWVDVLGWTLSEMKKHPNIMEAFYPDPQYRQDALDYMIAAEQGWREFDTYTKDGKVVRTSWANVRLSDGRSIGIGVDLTERVKIEKHLRASESQYRNLVETAHDLIWSVATDGKITYINQAAEQIYGYTPKEMIGCYYQDFVDEEQMEANNASWQIAIENNDRIFNFENWVQNKDGKRVLLNTNVVLVRDNDGNITGSMGTAQNITHRVEMENQHLYASKLELELEKERELIEIRERFVSLVSHEFRTPLAVMQSSTSLVRRYIDQLPQERVIEKLNTVSQQITRMVDLMEDALRFSKIRAGKADSRPEDVDLTLFFERIIHTLMIVDEHQHIVLLEGNTGTIYADVKLLDHIFSNLLSNALKYSPTGSTVTIAIEEHPDEWVFKIIDKGFGIPEEDMPQLFDPFYRATNARNKTGTGLGLSIVKEYVELHGGHISVESTLGLGSTFTIRIPTRI